MAGKRLLFATIGLLATSVAVVGVWLPGVPTVPPLIIALWAFSRSSERLSRWLKRLPVFAQALVEAERFERERTISWQVKLIAQSSAWTSTLVVYVVTRSALLTAIVAMVAISCSIFMTTIPTSNRRLTEESLAERISE